MKCVVLSSSILFILILFFEGVFLAFVTERKRESAYKRHLVTAVKFNTLTPCTFHYDVMHMLQVYKAHNSKCTRI